MYSEPCEKCGKADCFTVTGKPAPGGFRATPDIATPLIDLVGMVPRPLIGQLNTLGDCWVESFIWQARNRGVDAWIDGGIIWAKRGNR